MSIISKQIKLHFDYMNKSNTRFNYNDIVNTSMIIFKYYLVVQRDKFHARLDYIINIIDNSNLARNVGCKMVSRTEMVILFV